MNDWTTFTKRITINAKPETIYRAFATQSGIESWFLRISEFTSINGDLRHRESLSKKGDKYLWAWHGYSDETNQEGEVLETNGQDFFQFTFHDPMVVTVKILTENNISFVELTQINIPLDEDSRKNFFVGCGEGWTFYLANLKSVLEGGLDLRNKNEKIQNVVNS